MGKGFNNYMCKKFFHPASRDNLKRVWMAEQKADSYKKKQEELRIQYEKEQDLYTNKALLSKESKDKLSVNFMYEPPPGTKKEREREDDEPEYKFEWQRKFNAPREDYCKGDSEIRDQPFGIQVRNVRCIKCHKWGHINTDRECPMYNQASSIDQAASSLDPLLLVQQMREDGLAMKKSALSLQQHMKIPVNKRLLVNDEDQDSDDEATKKAELEFLKSLTVKQKRKLLKKLEKLEKKEKAKKNGKVKNKKKKQKRNSSESENENKIIKDIKQEQHSDSDNVHHSVRSEIRNNGIKKERSSSEDSSNVHKSNKKSDTPRRLDRYERDSSRKKNHSKSPSPSEKKLVTHRNRETQRRYSDSENEEKKYVVRSEVKSKYNSLGDRSKSGETRDVVDKHRSRSRSPLSKPKQRGRNLNRSHSGSDSDDKSSYLKKPESKKFYDSYNKHTDRYKTKSSNKHHSKSRSPTPRKSRTDRENLKRKHSRNNSEDDKSSCIKKESNRHEARNSNRHHSRSPSPMAKKSNRPREQESKRKHYSSDDSEKDEPTLKYNKSYNKTVNRNEERTLSSRHDSRSPKLYLKNDNKHKSSYLHASNSKDRNHSASFIKREQRSRKENNTSGSDSSSDESSGDSSSSEDDPRHSRKVDLKSRSNKSHIEHRSEASYRSNYRKYLKRRDCSGSRSPVETKSRNYNGRSENKRDSRDRTPQIRDSRSVQRKERKNRSSSSE